MHTSSRNHQRPTGMRWIRALLGAATLLWCIAATGCAALGNPVANGVPVRRLSPELLGESRASLELIPLSSLRQPPPDAYRLGAGDVLGIWIEGVIGEKGLSPPITYSTVQGQPPALGFPVPVRADGTLSLPLVEPILVKGKTLEETERSIREAYTVAHQILKPGQERIIVTLQRPRTYQVLVIRQDSSSGTDGTTGTTNPNRSAGFVIGFGGNGGRGSRRGTGFSLFLPAYENDLLNALARTGGLPGSDAVNEVIIERGGFRNDQEQKDVITCLEKGGRKSCGGQQIRIPLRMRAGECPTFRPEDVILQDGDIVYIEARDLDVFYTAGLLPAGQYILPRDADIDVVEAIAVVGGTIDAGATNATNVNGVSITPGLGSPSPSLVTVIRRTPNGGQVAIRVDLNKALRDPRERLLIQPRDIIVLQETPQEAFARYLSSQFNFSLAYTFLNSSRALGVFTGSVPGGTSGTTSTVP
jgi:protein involved in polysaccharide export with SLBB domain